MTKYWRDPGVSLQNTLSEIWTNSEWDKEELEKSPSLWGGWKIVWKNVHTMFQLLLEPMLLQTKRISYTTQQLRPFQDDKEIAPQRLELCAPVLLTWDPQWKTRWKMDWVRSLIFEARPLIHLTKPFHLKEFRSSWWRRKENKFKQPAHSSSEAIRSFFVFHDIGLRCIHQGYLSALDNRINPEIVTLKK